MKTTIPLLMLATILCSCHTINQSMYTESWGFYPSDTLKTYYLQTDPLSASFFKNNIEKLEQESLVERLLSKKGYTRTTDSSQAAFVIVATYWSAYPNDTVVSIKPVNVVVGSVPSKINTTTENDTRGSSETNSYSTQTRIRYNNVYAFSGKYDTITEVKRKVEYTFSLSAYKKNTLSSAGTFNNESLLWKSQVTLPYGTQYQTISSTSSYSQTSYLQLYSQLLFGFNRRKKYEFRSMIPLMIAASYDLIEKSSIRKKINFHEKYVGYQLLYPKEKKR